MRAEQLGRISAKRLLAAAAAGTAATVAVLAVFAVLIWRGQLPEDLSGDLALGAAFAGGITAGITAGKGRGALSGFLGGAAFAAAAAVIGAVQQQLDYFDRDYLRFLICALCGGAFGGIISTGKKTKNRRKRPAKVYRK